MLKVNHTRYRTTREPGWAHDEDGWEFEYVDRCGRDRTLFLSHEDLMFIIDGLDARGIIARPVTVGEMWINDDPRLF